MCLVGWLVGRASTGLGAYILVKGGKGGGGVTSPRRPTHPPTREKSPFPQGEDTKFTEKASNLRWILGMQTFFGL